MPDSNEQKPGAVQLKQTLHRRLLEAEETLNAICSGEVDAVVVEGACGQQVYTLESPDQPFRIFIEQMQEGAVTLNHGGTIVYCNRFFADLLQLPLEQVRGQALQGFVAAKAREPLEALLTAARHGVVHAESLLQAAGGEVLPVQLALNPLPDEQSGMLGMVVTDLSERERARVLEAKHKVAKEANAARDRFLAVVSHELRTPLNAILGWTQILRRHKDVPAPLQRGLEVIERSARTQTKLIEDLLDVSRVLAGKLRLEQHPVDLNSVIEAAVGGIQPTAEAKRIQLHTQFSEHPIIVQGDPNRLQQMIGNLLSNAVKFTPAEGEVRLTLREEGSHAEIEIADNGKGIPPESLPLLFELYQQIDGNPTQRTGGLGLGLAIVKQLTDMHGGEVRADSPGEGQGSIFTLRLPVSTVTAVAREQNAPTQATGEQTLEGLRLLIVEDEDDAREMLAQALGSVGARVMTVANAAEALRLVESETFDLLVSDIGLPEVDGYAFIRHVRAAGRTGRDLPAVALTAFAGPTDRREALLAGYQVHIPKPVDQDELCATIASLTGRPVA